jgi:cytochrome c oxidase assembly protein subunit 15
VVAFVALVLALTGLVRGQGEARVALGLVGLVALLQVGLGIMTVLAASPLSLSLLHQAGAAVLWMTAAMAARAAWR